MKNKGMTTTDKFQIKPDFYKSCEECVLAERKKINTNPRYDNFCQTHFTAGDSEQFNQYRDSTNGKLSIPDLPKDNIYYSENIPESVYWEKYKNINVSEIDNTFKYLFNKFKKGIFIKIKNGELKVFLPFSKKNFFNEWSHKIHVDPKYRNFEEFFRHVQKLTGYKFNPNTINKFVDTWYSNNHLIRYEFPVNEGDTNVPVTKDMLKTLCSERTLPDMEFYINRRDFPLLKKDGTEPYEHMFDTENQPLLSHNYEKYAPILSMVTAENFADIPIPTGDDWARITRNEGKYFSRSCSYMFDINPILWKDRKPIAVFRGSSTGVGITVETNLRLKLAYMSKMGKKDDDGFPYLDAGITEWNTRPRKIKGEKYIQVINPEKIPFSSVEKLAPQDQTKYKYIINVDGHVSAFRLSLELQMNSCILLVESKYKLWYSNLLKPFEHYIPIKSDLSDLIDKIKWCKKNDDKCEKIAQNAYNFSQKYLTKKGILDYLQKLLIEIKKVNSVYIYNEITPKQIVREKEERFLIKCKMLKGLPFGGLKKIETFSPNFEYEPKKLFSNSKGTVIKISKIGEYEIVLKNNPNIVHELFIAKNSLNKLSKQIPNFAFVFGILENCMVSQYIKGITFSDFLKTEFTMEKYLSILIQISLALQVSQNNFSFVHYDLMPWNIILKKLNKPIEVKYIIDYKTVYRVETDLIPILIDFERSHIVFKNIHYGTTEDVFNHSQIHDIFTILSSTIFEISNMNLSQKTIREISILANFISGTKYRENPFSQNSIGEIRTFFGKLRKYDETFSKKQDLDSKSPLDFVKYIISNFDYAFKVKIDDKLNITLNVNKNCFEKFVNCNTFNSLATFYLLEIARQNKIECKKLEHPNNFEEKELYNPKLYESFPIDSYVFQYPKYILEHIVLDKVIDIVKYKNELEYIILFSKLPEKVLVYYENYFKAILKLNSFNYKIQLANIVTLRWMSIIIYEKNIEKIQKENCNSFKEYLADCKKIIDNK